MEQSATPWRVFDAPATADGAEAAGTAAAPTATSAPSGLAAPGTRLALGGIAGALVIGAIAVFVALSGSGGQIVDAPSASGSGANDAALLAGAGDLVVDVTGAVTKPGLYHLPAGSRVGDAIDAAGGFSPRVDADKVGSALNLAAPLTDGIQVHVPSRDDPASAGAGGGGAGGSASGSGASGGGAGGGSLVDLNTATASELDALPGIGPVTAAKIIDSRTAAPFKTIDELRDRKLVGEKTFVQLKSLVTVG
ncbi:MAG TPA: ComEA family DNA-binding protein [Candidatus Limnocylindrales bacterium]|nr:ComEA family DNA-binding protein [Candidatus Limnocylindrales bacterium]